ncbi:MAG: pyridoxal phosphate-dependent aminotransferase [Nitrospira sp.]|nr:pyridoxal phosphate-dependent aminotransferase [Nitrospira sp.]MBX3341736.1 pyridoxal phosphate-dependent aminotransferase [Nitrospira sp.]MBX3370789.1 pyridoxal phosphate-dependent aminotransferase [Nitrospira sp.]MBX7039323.1 pyridoxal phosphate-dependent aminotransferase [Nitrospira sp.]MCW5796500.1 pyridoxal phosphate-dependent aminotransferase [Nitrospira sp.]
MKLAARVGRIVPSPTLSITATAKAMAAQGIDVIDFASGEPDFDTPEPVKAAAEAAIRAGFTKYTPSSGIDELRAAIVDKLKDEQGLQYDKSQILVSCGAKHSLYNVAEALLEAGDELIIPVPFWVSYQDQTLLNDATPVLLQTQERDGYTISQEALEAVITPRTKAIIVNSPCNPTGATYDRNTLERIAAVALRHDLVIISDEIYEKVLYDGVQHVSIASLSPEVAARTVVINGVSKAYAMTGWRIGYAAGPKPLLTAMANIQSQSTSNPCSISQKAAVAALRLGNPFTTVMVAEFDRRRRLMVERLNKMPGMTCRMPTGAFYAFPNVSGLLTKRWNNQPIGSAANLATFLLNEAQVALVPGEPFGSDVHIRLSYATSMEAIERGLTRIEAAIRRLS